LVGLLKPPYNTSSQQLQYQLHLLQEWCDKGKIKINQIKPSQITFTTKHMNCPPVTINNIQIPVQKEVKYLGLYLDQKLTRQKHFKAKRQHLNLKVQQMSWLLGRKSELSLVNKILVYKCILKPIWTYGIQLWGCTKPTNTKVLQRFQSNVLCSITNAPMVCIEPHTTQRPSNSVRHRRNKEIFHHYHSRLITN
jgi:hypothetical protein